MIGSILENWIVQLVLGVGMIVIFGLIIWLLNRAFFKLMGRKARPAVMLTGFIGVPAHELGHALFCVVFRHRIHEIKLYQPNSKDGVLGFVRHSYNKKSLYQRMGLFFIATGPIILGTALIFLLMWIFVVDIWRDISAITPAFQEMGLRDIPLIFSSSWEALGIIFSGHNFGYWEWWAFMIPALSVSLFMSMSVADVNSAKSGFAVIAGVFLIVNIILGIINIDIVYGLTYYMLRGSFYIANFMAVAVLMATIIVLIALIIYTIIYIMRRISGRAA